MKASLKTRVLIAIILILCIVSGGMTGLKYTKQEKKQVEDVRVVASVNNMFKETVAVVALAIEEETRVVYKDMTMTELAAKLDRILKNELAGKGELIASYSLEKGVDPYIATAIMLEETGCAGKSCSKLVRKCNNVGGQKGEGCGKYRSFASIDDGIKGLIDNLSKNYFSKGIKTPEQINKKYATSKTWKDKINNYVKKIERA